MGRTPSARGFFADGICWQEPVTFEVTRNAESDTDDSLFLQGRGQPQPSQVAGNMGICLTFPDDGASMIFLSDSGTCCTSCVPGFDSGRMMNSREIWKNVWLSDE